MSFMIFGFYNWQRYSSICWTNLVWVDGVISALIGLISSWAMRSWRRLLAWCGPDRTG